MRRWLPALAAGAGVAVSTAAEILRAPDGARYATETTQRVLETARRINYIPSAAARALVSKSTRTLGLVLQAPRAMRRRFVYLGTRYKQARSRADCVKPIIL